MKIIHWIVSRKMKLKVEKCSNGFRFILNHCVCPLENRHYCQEDVCPMFPSITNYNTPKINILFWIEVMFICTVCYTVKFQMFFFWWISKFRFGLANIKSHFHSLSLNLNSAVIAWNKYSWFIHYSAQTHRNQPVAYIRNSKWQLKETLLNR